MAKLKAGKSLHLIINLYLVVKVVICFYLIICKEDNNREKLCNTVV